MTNYNQCKDINEFYFASYGQLSPIMPLFFEPSSPEGQIIQNIETLIGQNRYDEAITLAEISLQQYPHTQTALLTWQILAYWKQGKLPNSEFAAYFESLENLLPDQAYLNFNKAALLVKDKKFNEAVKELKVALTKDSNHSAALVLQFWIFYFSKDPDWKKTFSRITALNILPDKITNLIHIVESIKEKKSTPLYSFADQDDLKSRNLDLFRKFPELVLAKPPTSENLLLVGVETTYLKEFVPTFLLSTLDLREKIFGLHVHVYDASTQDLEFLKYFDQAYPQLNLSYSYEGKASDLNTSNKSYYASMRFCRAYQILEQNPSLKKIAIIDADALVRKNPFTQDAISKNEILVTKASDVAPLWDKFAGGFSCFTKTEFSLNAFAHLTNVLLKNFSARQDFWFIDQVALADMYKYHSQSKKIHCATFTELFGKDSAHTENSIFWTYSNEDKFRDNPMNRERQRLSTEHNIPHIWNTLAKA